MRYTYEDGNVVLSDCNSFVISQILECGQCFRFNKLDEEDYIVTAFGKAVRIKEIEGNIVFFDTVIEDFENIWFDYFDLKRDYDSLKSTLGDNDIVLRDAVEFAPGIRILNQEFFECLISFIISQNNRIPMIKKVIKNISERYGNYIKTIEGEEYYSFPKVEQLLNATEAELMECRTGFRAKYIIDAVSKVASGEVNFDKFDHITTDMVRENLISIKGVGPKVADCVLLFSCKRGEVFPTDVWIKRVMSHFYFDDNDTPIKEIHKLADEKYGKHAGFAQQYLFNYARQFKIGTDKK